MKHSQEEYWRPRFHAPPLRSHPDPPPTIQCSWYPYEGQCPYMRLALICWRSNGECTFTDMQKIEKQIKIQEKLKDEMQKKCAKEGTEFDESKFESGIPIESLEMFENIAFLMHKHGDLNQPDDINEWLDQFETFDIYEILPEIMEMWKSENKQMSVPKKKRGK